MLKYLMRLEEQQIRSRKTGHGHGERKAGGPPKKIGMIFVLLFLNLDICGNVNIGEGSRG